MQGFNMGRYHPPSSLDHSLSTTSAPKNPHPLGARARKLPQGILTVRFEMPFAIWCSTCPSTSNSQLIGQGVRFNAEKKKVGNYLSTPVWSFRMKHTACGGWIEIRTDPKNTEYVVTEGARKRDTGDDLKVAVREGAVVLGGAGEEDERERKRRDAFAALEGKVEDKVRAKGEAARLEELKSLRERDWRDADAAGRKLRTAFRVGRKDRERARELNAAIQERMNFGFDVVDEIGEDQLRADLVEFGNSMNGGESAEAAELSATRKPLFGNGTAKSSNTQVAAKVSQKEKLHQQLSKNTRAAVDPFTVRVPLLQSTSMSRSIPGMKRKRHGMDDRADISENISRQEEKDVDRSTTISDQTGPNAQPQPISLVGYDSD